MEKIGTTTKINSVHLFTFLFKSSFSIYTMCKFSNFNDLDKEKMSVSLRGKYLVVHQLCSCKDTEESENKALLLEPV